MSPAEQPSDVSTSFTPPDAPAQSPQHGFQGDRGRGGSYPSLPLGLTIAVSREAGARGGTLARRVGRKLGWQVYNQELLEYIAQEGAFRENLLAGLPANALRWTDEQLEQLLAQNRLSREAAILDLARTILAVGAQGEAVMLGRGAGCVLPRDSTLHVRIVAPLNDRIAYMSQWLRLTLDDAAEQVRLRDQNRGHFLKTHFQSQPGDIYQYDLVLNSSLLGEDLCAELIVKAARAKHAARFGTSVISDQ
jgi:cytidylate kinase